MLHIGYSVLSLFVKGEDAGMATGGNLFLAKNRHHLNPCTESRWKRGEKPDGRAVNRGDDYLAC